MKPADDQDLRSDAVAFAKLAAARSSQLAQLVAGLGSGDEPLAETTARITAVNDELLDQIRRLYGLPLPPERDQP